MRHVMFGIFGLALLLFFVTGIYMYSLKHQQIKRSAVAKTTQHNHVLVIFVSFGAQFIDYLYTMNASYVNQSKHVLVLYCLSFKNKLYLKKNKRWRKKLWKSHAKINPGRLFFAKLKNIHVIFEAMFAYRNTENKISVGLH